MIGELCGREWSQMTQLRNGDLARDIMLDCTVIIIEVLDGRRAPFVPTARVKDDSGNIYEVPLEWLVFISH